MTISLFSQAVIDKPDRSYTLTVVSHIKRKQEVSTQATAQEGAKLAQGEEFGYFTFGGSDIIIMFEADKVKITAQVGTHYN